MILPTLLVALGSASCGPQQTPAAKVPPGITWIGAGSLPADATDRLEGMNKPIDGTEIPQNRVGSLGSGIDWSGSDDHYYAACDRGPSDGAADYFPRFQYLSIAVDAQAASVKVEIVGTALFVDEKAQLYSGLSSRIDPRIPSRGARLDTESIRASRTGTLFTSDEYGPWIDEWKDTGEHVRRLTVPAKFYVEKLGAKPADELPPNNTSGRQSNRGMEGLARSPDGKFLYGVMQSPLIQDGALDEKQKRIGTNVRVLELELATGKSREFLYVLENAKNGVNEIVAAGPRTLLTIERDGAEGAKAEFKRVYKVELDGASDVSALEQLPSKDIPKGVVPLRKSPFLDFLDPRFGLAGEKMPEKIEGLTFGPKLADGRLLLIVSIDNDFRPDVPNTFWAFAVDPALLPGFEPAVFDAR